MRNTRHFAVNCFFYDRCGIQSRLEALAEKGWELQAIDYLGWRFKRTEPKKLRYAVTYFAKAGAYTPETDASLAEFNELCAHSGWNYVASASNLRVYCNENADPVPFETEPLVELETIHRAAKKSFLRAHYGYIGLSVLMLALMLWLLFASPISALSRSILLLVFLIFPAALVMSLVELTAYYRWRRKALIAAEETGEFLPSRSHPVFMRVMVALIILLFLAYFALEGLDRESFGFLIRSVGILVLGFAVYRSREHFKQAGCSQKENAHATLGICVALAVLLTVFSNAMTSDRLLDGLFPENSGEQSDVIYVHNGSEYRLYRHSLPIYMDDIYDVDGMDYSNWKRSESSLFMELTEVFIDRRVGIDVTGPIELNYTYIETAHPFFCELIERELSKTYTESDYYAGRHTELVPIDPSPWKAAEVWQFCYKGVPSSDYLVRWEQSLLCIFPAEPITGEQMTIIADKLEK